MKFAGVCRAAYLAAVLCWHAGAQNAGTSVEAHFSAAQAAQRSGDLERAVREYRAILLLNPAFAEVHMNLGLVLHAQNRFDESAAALGRCLQLKPGLFAAALFQGINYCKLGRPAEAVSLLARCAAEQPANKQARFWFASALVGAGRASAAVVELEKASEVLQDDVDILQLLGEAYQKAAREEAETVKAIAPDSIERRLLLAESFLTQREWMGAQVYYRKLLEENPALRGAHLGLGMALLRMGRTGEAVRQFEDELRSDTWSVEAHCGLAEALILEGKPQEALGHLKSALAIRPGDARLAIENVQGGSDGLPESARARYQAALSQWDGDSGPAALLGAALAYFGLGENDKAESRLRAIGALEDQMRATPVPRSRAEALECVRRRQYEAGIAGLRHHLERQPRDRDARVALAQAYVQTREPARAIQELRDVLRTDPKLVTAHLWLGKSYRDMALLTFDRIVSLQPDSYRAHQLLAEAYEARKQDSKAIAEYRAALEVRPKLPGLHLAIGRIHLKNLRLEEAAAEFQKELEINPFDADANTDLGGIYVNQELPEKAIPLLEQALRVEPSLVEAHRRLGKAYYALGQYEKAESELRQAAQFDEDGSTHYMLARTYRHLGRTREAEEQLQMVTRIKADRLKQAQERAERVRKVDP